MGAKEPLIIIRTSTGHTNKDMNAPLPPTHQSSEQLDRPQLCCLIRQVVVLENVLGLNKVMSTVRSKLAECGPYCIAVLEIDPARLGADIRRPRLFIIMIDESFLARETRPILGTAGRGWSALGVLP